LEVFIVNVLGFVQLTQATPPFGGYSYSFGIEGMAQRKELTNAQQLLALLKGALHAAIGPADGVASGISYRAARQGDLSEILEVCHVMSSDRLPLEMRLASLQMGRHLWELSRQWDWAQSVHEQLDPMARKNDLHHAVAFGALISEATSSQARAIAAYLFNTVKSMVMDAIRTIPLDEATGQRLLGEVQPTIAELASQCVDKHAGDIVALRSGGSVPGGGSGAGDAFRDLFQS
jgi:urease accessory protein